AARAPLGADERGRRDGVGLGRVDVRQRLGADAATAGLRPQDVPGVGEVAVDDADALLAGGVEGAGVHQLGAAAGVDDPAVPGQLRAPAAELGAHAAGPPAAGPLRQGDADAAAVEVEAQGGEAEGRLARQLLVVGVVDAEVGEALVPVDEAVDVGPE